MKKQSTIFYGHSGIQHNWIWLYNLYWYSGPLASNINDLIISNDLNVCSVISGNRNFEGRIHPLVKSNYLASPPLVLIFALAGRIDIDFSKRKLLQ